MQLSRFNNQFYSIFMRIAICILVLLVTFLNDVAGEVKESEERPTAIEMLVPDTATYTKDYWTTGMMVVGEDSMAVDYRGRGHSTFAQPKHPYALRLSAPASLLGMKEHTRWVLLANFFDHSLMRNALALDVSRQTSLAAVTPQGRFVSLSVNGKPQGLYYLCERVSDCVTDSLIEIDVYEQEEQRAKSLALDSIPRNMPIDTLSFIDAIIVYELCMNAEPNGPRSCYFHTDGKTLYAGPVWDFDMAFNKVGVDDGGDIRPMRFFNPESRPQWLKGKVITWLDETNSYTHESPVFQSYFNDSVFRGKMSKRWNELKPKFRDLLRFMKHCDKFIRNDAIIDQKMWNHLEPARFDDASDYDAAYRKLRATYKKRMKRLDNVFK